MEAVIQTEGLTKYYCKARGILGIRLSIAQGDVFGFIGPNGAGKSTTIRLLLGLIAPTRGRATVLGLDCWKRRTEVARQVGYMPAEAAYYGGMRGEEIIALSAKLHGRDCAAETRRLCDRFEVETRKKVEALSLGNRRKLSIVCAMQHQPQLLILDEPTSGLDPLMQREFFALLKERNEQGATIFLSSHVLSVIQRHCRHAGIVREGRLIVSDTVEALTRSAARRVLLTGVSEPPALDDIRDVRRLDGAVSFLYAGAPPRLVEALQGLPLTDMTVTEPDLDEVFMHYYNGEAQEDDAV